MNRRALLLGLVASACHRSAPPRGFGQAALGVARAAGELSAQQGSWSATELGRIAALAVEALKRSPALPVGRVLCELLFEQLGFVREVTDTSLEFVLLPSVLKKRRGSCVGLGTVFMALADALGHAACGVLMPGHFYVRLRESGGVRNVELLRRGEAMSDAWYLGRFPVPGGSAREYARPLTPDEALGVIEYNVGNERRRQLRLEEARQAYVRSVRLFPEFSEAHASLGAALHVLGRLDEARASYQSARASNPHLPGVDWNLTMLDEERRSSQP